MTLYDDQQTDRPVAAESDPVEVTPADTPVKVYDRPARTTPVWLLLLFVLLALAVLWFLFAYIF